VRRPVRAVNVLGTPTQRLAASGQPLRLIQEFMGHADSETTQIYSHYAPSEHEVQVVNDAFAPSRLASLKTIFKRPIRAPKPTRESAPRRSSRWRPRAALPARRGTIQGTN
jgi:hypothetical protein